MVSTYPHPCAQKHMQVFSALGKDNRFGANLPLLSVAFQRGGTKTKKVPFLGLQDDIL